MKNVSVEQLIGFGARLLEARGMSAEDARYVSEIVVATHATGITTHGLAQFSYLVDNLGGSIEPQGRPAVVCEKAASAVIDGNRACGQVSMRLAKEVAAAKARECGIAMVAVRNTFWLGALGPHILSLAQDGLLAQLWAQSATCKDCAPVGGIDATFSTNPVAIAFPTAGDPVLGDVSTATVSLGKAFALIRRGERAPAPIFMDREGNVTDDPTVMENEGSILFLGGAHYGHKGYALSLWCEALTAVAGGDCNNPEVEQRQTFSLTVIDPAAYSGADYYYREMTRFLERVKSSRPRPGIAEIRLPGERSQRTFREAERNGAPLDDDQVNTLNELAAKCGVDPLPTGDE